MMGRIKSLIKIFKETYSKANEDKIQAHEWLDKIEKLRKIRFGIYENLVRADSILSLVVPRLPKEIVQHYIQPLSKFFDYGYKPITRINGTPFVDDPKEIGFIEDMKKIVDEIDVVLEEARTQIKNDNFGEIEKLYDRAKEIVDTRLKYYKLDNDNTKK